MSPEQYSGAEATERSDQFSFCVALWEALYGARPFPGKTPAAIAYAIGNDEIMPVPEDHAVPGWLKNVLLRGLSRDPEARFPDLNALLAALASYRDTTLGVGRKARVLFVAISCLIVLPLIGGASLAVRIFGVPLDFQLAIFLSVASVAGIGAALHLLREPMTRSGMSEQLYRAFIAYLGFGPAMRLAGGLLDVPIPKVLMLELVGTGLFGIMVALGFDRRLLKLILPFAIFVGVAISLPEWALELHTLGHVLLFGASAMIWVRDGFAPPSERPTSSP